MNESTIDNLFAAMAPAPPDAGVSAGARARDDSDEFGNRLRQASAPPAEPWWRASPNRSPTNQSSSAAGSATRPPLPSSTNRAPKADKDQSPPRSDATSDSSRSTATEKSDRSARRDDKLPTRDDEKSSSDLSAAATAATGVAKPAPAKADDGDKSTNDESAAAKIEAADAQKADATTAVSLPIAENSSHASAPGAAAGKNVPSAPQEVATSAQQSTVLPADPNAEVANTNLDASVAVAVAAKPTVQPASAATAAAATETPIATAGDPESTVDATSTKKPDAKAVTNSKSAPKVEDQAVIAPVKRLPAVQVNADGSQPNVAAVDATAANDQKPSVKQDPSPASDKATVDQPQPTAPIPTNSNQAVPVVAAVTAIVVTEQAAVNGNDAAGQKVTKASGPPNSSTLSAFGRVDRGTGSLTASGPKQAGDGPDMPSIDPARFVSRVAKAIETAQDRGGPLSLRLSPPELGSMRIQLDVKQGVMTAKVETDTAVARQALLDNLPTLRDRLAEHNVRIDRFDVDVRRDGNGDQASPGKQQQQFQQNYNQTSASRVPSTTARIGDGAATEPAPIERVITDTSINLVA